MAFEHASDNCASPRRVPERDKVYGNASVRYVNGLRLHGAPDDARFRSERNGPLSAAGEVSHSIRFPGDRMDGSVHNKILGYF